MPDKSSRKDSFRPITLTKYDDTLIPMVRVDGTPKDENSKFDMKFDMPMVSREPVGKHEKCGGEIYLHQSSETHNVLRCNGNCGLRVPIAVQWTDYGTLLRHLDEINPY